MASCDQKSCTVSAKDDPSKHFLVPKKNALPPLYWSQDDKLVFFVKRAPTWRMPTGVHSKTNGMSLYTSLLRAFTVY